MKYKIYKTKKKEDDGPAFLLTPIEKTLLTYWSEVGDFEEFDKAAREAKQSKTMTLLEAMQALKPGYVIRYNGDKYRHLTLSNPEAAELLSYEHLHSDGWYLEKR